MSYINNYKAVTIFLILLLVFIKSLIFIEGRINISTLFFWSLPMCLFIFTASVESVKGYQIFCFILLIYFLLASLRVFGMQAFYLDICEIFFISALFTHCLFGPRIINSVK